MTSRERGRMPGSVEVPVTVYVLPSVGNRRGSLNGVCVCVCVHVCVYKSHSQTAERV